MTQPEKLIPPAPHYPYWRYYCPVCKEWREGELQRTHFEVTCPDCYELTKAVVTEHCYECGSEETVFVVEVNGIEFPVCYNCFEKSVAVENNRELDEELKRSFEERWKNFTSRLSS